MAEHISGANVRGGDAPHGAPPKMLLRPCLLLLLDENPACGYALRDGLRPFAPSAWDAGGIYRALNTMEDEGLVSSSWERSTSGPQRRCYRLTERGRTVLAGWASELRVMRTLINSFLDRYARDLEAHAAILAGSAEAPSPSNGAAPAGVDQPSGEAAAAAT